MGLLAKVSSLFHGAARSAQYPSEEWLDAASKFNELTPDLAKLEEKSHHLVFLYGTNQQGHRDHDLVAEHGVVEATAFTAKPHTMFKKDLGVESYPIAVRRKYHKIPFTRIKGELVSLNSYRFKELDAFIQGQVQFNPADEGRGPPKIGVLPFLRKRAMVVVPYRVPWTQNLGHMPFLMRVCAVEAWMYVGNPAYWDDVVDNGYLYPAVQVYRPRHAWDRPYYSFNKSEYEKK